MLALFVAGWQDFVLDLEITVTLPMNIVKIILVLSL